MVTALIQLKSQRALNAPQVTTLTRPPTTLAHFARRATTATLTATVCTLRLLEPIVVKPTTVPLAPQHQLQVLPTIHPLHVHLGTTAKTSKCVLMVSTSPLTK